MMVQRCKRCHWGENATVGETPLVWCRGLPERPIVQGDSFAWLVPAKSLDSWCSLFKLSWWKTIRGLFRGYGA